MANNRTLPLGDALAPTIDRLRDIAALAGDALLTEGPVTPDRVLLDTCADALHFFKQAESARAARGTIHDWASRQWSAAEYKADAALVEEMTEATRRGRALLLRTKKLGAQTPAGIYAKALVVRCLVTGAAELAMSLAEDLLACEGLRAILWPVGRGV